jgi:hypothetical protein
MKVELYHTLTPYQQAVILLLESIQMSLKNIEKVGNE